MPYELGRVILPNAVSAEAASWQAPYPRCFRSFMVRGASWVFPWTSTEFIVQLLDVDALEPEVAPR
jgi:hypothetical protein